jgi:Peptidase family M28/Fibronectin type III domain/WD40-like Beta Propeller Repeat
MTRTLGTVLIAAVVLAAPDSSLRLADLAWERGDYVAALSGYLRLLDSPSADSALESIALQTGELYRSTEVTTDGVTPQFSPDGRQLLYESGLGPGRLTRVLSTADPTHPLMSLRGWSADFSPDGTTVGYLKLVDSPEVTAAQKAADDAPSSDRTARQTALTELLASSKGSRVTLRDLASGRETEIVTEGLSRSSLVLGTGDTVVFSGFRNPKEPSQLYIASPTRAPVAATTDATDKTIVSINSTGTAVTFTARAPGGRGAGRGGPSTGLGAGGGGGGGGGAGPALTSFGVLSVPDGKVTTVSGTAPSFSADGRTIIFVGRSGTEYSVLTIPTSDPATIPVTIRKGPERVDAPTLSADGTRVAFQLMYRDDWELVTTTRDGTAETRITRDIQHDLLPQFLSNDRVLGVIGEPRHRRSFLYDLPSGTRTRLFHNNTIRTIAPEYVWKISPDGTKVLIVAERDGDTVSLERGVYLMDLTQKVTRDEVRARVMRELATEEALRAKAVKLYAPFADPVKAIVSDVSVSRIYDYEKALFDFDSKHISKPGNKQAAEYLFNSYQSFGYTPEYQWFERQNALGGRTANVVATLKGTVNPELIYVVSSHYDSVAVGPGADDDSSGTAALLETARVLAAHPQPATIVFASFTGEEAGLLGSREFVRRAVADKLRIVGALNNDMVGWANDARLDNTIRYSNPGIRDVQHAAALQFTNLITYDALYYKGTDAAAYYEAFGDIVGGIGSYPVLSSPHYHQSHDVLENMNHQLITEVAKTTVATLVLLASSPSRLTELKVDRFTAGSATLSWKPSPESGVTGYLVSYGPPSKPDAQQVRVAKPTVALTKVEPGTVVAVKAVNEKGLESWDAAKIRIENK